ncbi:MAG: endonuclease III [Duncaniella sp.]|nr:endonuclease III [Duncaniella sp.]
MTLAQRYKAIIERFEAEMPDAQTELRYGNPFELLVAVILSAQCTDKRVNLVTPPLFAAFPTPEKLAEAESDEVFEYIRSVSYPNNKTRSLIGMARKLVADFGSEVPATIDELLTIPGVGRKTANVILSVVYDRAAMAVDTHVFRVSHRLGLVPARAATPLAVEKCLVRHIPEEKIARAHHWLILHGRYICKARRPECETCYLTDLCAHYAKNHREKQ